MARTASSPRSLHTSFGELARVVPPHAITSESHHEEAIAMIDRLMAAGRLSREQSLYLETLVQLVQAYEAAHEAIDVAGLSGLAALKHLLTENGMSASDLARLLKVHVSLGSKILNGDRSLTVDHIKRLAARFSVSPALFFN